MTNEKLVETSSEPENGNVQWHHENRRVRVESVPALSVEDDTALNGVFLDLVKSVDTPSNAVVSPVMASSETLDFTAALDELRPHALP